MEGSNCRSCLEVLPMKITRKSPWIMPFLLSSPFPNLCPNLKSIISSFVENSMKETVYSSQRKDRSVFLLVLSYCYPYLSPPPPKQTLIKPSMMKELRNRLPAYPMWLEERTTKSAQSWDSLLPSSVMMGMLTPVVIDGWRNIPCTGLLSGEDLSIPGGVKPSRKEREGEKSEAWKAWEYYE